MPSFREHHRLTVDFLGWDLPEVHRTIDAAAAYLGGRHRVVGHNVKMARAIEDLFGRRGLVIFTCHLLEDAGILTRSIERSHRDRRTRAERRGAQRDRPVRAAAERTARPTPERRPRSAPTPERGRQLRLVLDPASDPTTDG